ncbi:MAG: SpoIIE family protein phosphatase [Pseudomonadota bacterium]
MNVFLSQPDARATDAASVDPDPEPLQRLCAEHHIVLQTQPVAELRELVLPGDVVLCVNPEQLCEFDNWPLACGLVLVTDHGLDGKVCRSLLHSGFHDCLSLAELRADLPGFFSKLAVRMDNLQQVLGAPNRELALLREELEQDQKAAQHIQMSMMPASPQQIADLHFSHEIAASLMLSGDFVDYFALGDNYSVFYMGDVSGHGASAAFITVLLKEHSRHVRAKFVAGQTPDPGALLQELNHILLEHQLDKHVAMFLGVYDAAAQMLYFCSAAHFPPAIAVIDGVASPLEQQGKPLGLFPDVPYNARALAFPTGARLVLFSDGVLELLPQQTLAEKEALLCEWVAQCEEFAALWSNVKVTARGLDDVSCLMVTSVGDIVGRDGEM